jgi:hypothetical protein
MSRAHILATLLFLIIFGSAAVPARAQDEVPIAVTDQNRSGDLPFSSVIGSATEHVVINSGNLVVNIPIAHLKGRNGRDFDFGLRYDGRNLVIANLPQSVCMFEAHNYAPSNGIWQTNQSTLSFTSYKRVACKTTEGNGTATGNNGYILQDETGAKHALAVNYESAECPSGSWNYRNSGPDSSNAGVWGQLSAVYQAYGPMRARLNPLDPSGSQGAYFHGQFGDAFHSEGWTHGCLSYGRDTTMIDYMSSHFGNTWTGVSVGTQVEKPQ